MLDSKVDIFSNIRKAVRGLASINNSGAVWDFIGKTILTALELKSIYIISLRPDDSCEMVHDGFSPGQNAAGIKTDILDNRVKKIICNETISLFRDSAKIIVKNSLIELLKELSKEDAFDRVTDEMNVHNADAVAPVFSGQRLLALMFVGEKLSGDALTSDELGFISVISDLAASSLQKSCSGMDQEYYDRFASMGMMSATFAHEIRNPLTALKTFVQLFPEKHDDDEFRDRFSQIMPEEIKKIDVLIEEFLDISTGEKSSRTCSFNINALIDELVDHQTNRLFLEKSSVFIQKNYDPDIIKLWGNVERLRCALLNIINNGCQAIDKSGIIKINVTSLGRNVDIEIADSGTGIHPDDIDKIYDPFMTTRENGTGLGLAISKKIIEDHGGALKVVSDQSGGTTFTVTLPVDRRQLMG